MSLVVHQVRACSGRARPSASSTTTTAVAAAQAPHNDNDNGGHNNDNEQEDPMDVDTEPPFFSSSATAATSTTDSTTATALSTPPRRRNGNRVVPSTAACYETPASSANASSLRRRRLAQKQQQQQQQRRTTFQSQEIVLDTSQDEDDDGDNNNGGSGGVLQVGEIIDLVEDSPVAAATMTTTAAGPQNIHDNHNNDAWACPQCTLLNANTERMCAACNYHNRHIVRPPDPMRRGECLIDSTSGGAGGAGSPLRYVGGGALFGSLLGAAVSAHNGRPIFSGAAEGALGGAVGGAFLQDWMGTTGGGGGSSGTSSFSNGNNNNNNNNNNIAQARTSGAMGMAGYPSMSTSSRDNSGSAASRRQQQPRSSYRVVQQQGPNGSTTTIITGGRDATRIVRTGGAVVRQQHPNANTIGTQGINDPLMSLMLHSFLQEQQGGGGMGRAAVAAAMGGGQNNVDGMSYEQLLQAFGDGTDNLGAQEGHIQQLPTHKLDNPTSDLPEDARQCLICLEDFEKGDVRKTLPCLHGFHEACADKWLRTNGSCPICKHKITGTNSTN
jgi:hypothetical protein